MPDRTARNGLFVAVWGLKLAASSRSLAGLDPFIAANFHVAGAPRVLIAVKCTLRGIDSGRLLNDASSLSHTYTQMKPKRTCFGVSDTLGAALSSSDEIIIMSTSFSELPEFASDGLFCRLEAPVAILE